MSENVSIREVSWVDIFFLGCLGAGVLCGCSTDSTSDTVDAQVVEGDALMADAQTNTDMDLINDMSVYDVSFVDGEIQDAFVADATLGDAQASDLSMMDADVQDANFVDAEPEEPSCVPPVSRLQYEVWPTVFEGRCTLCHYEGGSADQHPSDIDFVLRDPSEPGRFETSTDVHAHNLELIIANRLDAFGEPYLLRKVSGAIPHGGGALLDMSSIEYQALEALYEQYDLFQMEICEDDHEESVSHQQVMERVELRTAEETFRAFTVQVLGRLPTTFERTQIRRGNVQGPMLSTDTDAQPSSRNSDDGASLSAAPAKSQMTVVKQLIDGLSQDSAFRHWLKDQWNDVFM
ncbi:MAG: hypothetical protein ACPGQS_02695, partial [Bradymonadia bacterium]